MPYAKNKINVKVPKFSGFDKSHRNTGTILPGTITPILCDELIPGSRVSLKVNLAAQLAPLVSDTYMNLKLKTEAFFCPSRLCCASFEDWFNCVPAKVGSSRYHGASSSPSYYIADVAPRLPVLETPAVEASSEPKGLTKAGFCTRGLRYHSCQIR